MRLAQQTHLGIGQQPDGRRLQLGGLRRTVNRPFGRYGTHRETIGRTHLQPLDGGRRQRRRPFGHPHALFRIQFVIVALGVAHGIPREGERPFGDRAFEPSGAASSRPVRAIRPRLPLPRRVPDRRSARHRPRSRAGTRAASRLRQCKEGGHRTTPPCLRRDRERHVDPLRRIAAGLQPHASGRFGRRQIEPRREAQIERTLHIDRSQRKESARSQDDIPAAAHLRIPSKERRRPPSPVRRRSRFERTRSRDARNPRNRRVRRPRRHRRRTNLHSSASGSRRPPDAPRPLASYRRRSRSAARPSGPGRRWPPRSTSPYSSPKQPKDRFAPTRRRTP